MNISSNAAKILIVEDDPAHARLIQKNLMRENVVNEIVIVHDGQKAIDYMSLDKEDPEAETILPAMVLLDLHLPIKNGFQVLEHVKSDDRTKLTPVFVLTNSDDSIDITRCYELGCNSFIIKPADYDTFSETIRNLGKFLSTITCPVNKV